MVNSFNNIEKLKTFGKYDTFVKDKLTTQHKGLIIPIKKNNLLLFIKTPMRDTFIVLIKKPTQRHLLHADVAVSKGLRKVIAMRVDTDVFNLAIAYFQKINASDLR